MLRQRVSLHEPQPGDQPATVRVDQARRGARAVWLKCIYAFAALTLTLPLGAHLLYRTTGTSLLPSRSLKPDDIGDRIGYEPSFSEDSTDKEGKVILEGKDGIRITIGKEKWTLHLHQPHDFVKLSQQVTLQSFQDVLGVLSQLYRSQHGREQPQGFHQWWEFAIRQQCMLDGYNQIEEDLAPFRSAYRGRLPNDIMVAMKNVSSAIVIQIKQGVLSATPVKDLWSSDPIIDRWSTMLQPFAQHLPDMHIVVNALDYPRVWLEHVSSELEAKMKGKLLSVTDAYQQWGCRGPHELNDAVKYFAMFVSPDPQQMQPIRQLLPVFSACKVPTCFFDIVAPTFWALFRDPTTGAQDVSNAMCLGNQDLQAQVPSWEKKIPKLVWRGSTTGGYAHAGNPRLSKPRYLHMHRQRLVAAAQQLNSSLLDIGFTNFTQCAPRACEAMESQFGRVGTLTPAEVFSYKYLMVVGGNSFAERLTRYLCSESLVFMTNVLGEWYHSWLKPFVHYIPVQPDYSDLLQKVQWAMEHDDEAQRIVRNANIFVRRYARAESIECYMYRLLLEYHAAVGST